MGSTNVEATELKSVLNAELDRLAALPPNWDGYGAPPLDARIVAAARQFVAHLAGFADLRPLVMPMSSGALQFEWHQGETILEFEVETPDTIHYLKWKPSDDVQEEDDFAIDDVERASSLMQWFSGAVTNG